MLESKKVLEGTPYNTICMYNVYVKIKIQLCNIFLRLIMLDNVLD